ncbi:MAG TPA: lipopolysaccharide kinase InaA family protein, partial [bacterium]|nr:lipopolysaccharide kinase InaA family protein [bacterium]
MTGYKNVSTSNMKGWVRGDILPLLPPGFLDDPVTSVRKMDHEVVKASRLRWAALWTLPNGKKVFLKRDRTKDWIESLKFLVLPSRGRTEWWIAFQSQKRNLTIPKPLGWMEKVRRGMVKESFYLSEAVGSGDSLMDLVLSGTAFSFEGLVKTVRKIHDAGLLHRDFHSGNFLLDEDSFYLTDLHRARIVQSLSLKQRLWSLAHLFHSLRSCWGEEKRAAFLMRYFEGEPRRLKKKEAFLETIRRGMDRLQKRHWKSRTKRCQKESTDFSVKREGTTAYYHRREFPLDQIKRVLEKHLRMVTERPSALAKNGPEVAVSLFDDEGKRFCVKQFRYPRFRDELKEYFRRSKGLKSWIAGNGLRARGVPSLLPIALAERKGLLRGRESFFVMEALKTGREMDRYLSGGLGHFKRKRLFIRAFAQWLSNFHKTGLYHKDMKTCNLYISENGEAWDFRL